MAGIGPAPFAGMMLSDMGAEVIRIDRLSASGLGIDMPRAYDVTGRGRRSLALDLKSEAGIRTVRKLSAKADALIEGFRPGVMERLGLGPEHLSEINPRLVFGRVTGWGQSGPLAETAGHDINYIALTGMLHAVGPSAKPYPPLNLIGDYGGGAMFLAFGVVCALLEAQRSGRGQVVDAAMVDGASTLGAAMFGLLQARLWTDSRGVNLLDGGSPFYDTYETRDGSFVAVGPIETKFYELFLAKLGLDEPALKDRSPGNWDRLRAAFTEAFKTRDRDEWSTIFGGSDACVAPVLTLAEAPRHPHMTARDSFLAIDGVMQPAPAPRFSRTAASVPSPPPGIGEHGRAILTEWGFGEEEIAEALP